ncbi:MAG: hypothetical protein ACFE0O_08880 [Opitutales bacterium]
MPNQKSVKLTIGSLIAGVSAHGAIQHFTTPITSDNATFGAIGWDVDGQGGDDEFVLNNNTDTFITTSTTYTSTFKKLETGTGGGFGFVRVGPSNPSLKQLNTTSSIGATVASFVLGDRVVMSYGNAAGGLTAGTQYIGFFFDNNGTNNFGWAKVTLTNGGQFGTFTIEEWAYDDSGADIRVGDTVSAIPEPEAAAIGLGALALGAAGLRRLRKNKQAA